MLHGKKVRPAVAITVLLFGGLILLNKFVFNPGDKIIGIDGELEKTAVELNKMCPIQADEETRMDKAEAPGDKTLIYYLTLVNMTQATFDTTEFKRTRWPEMVNEFKNGEKTKLLRDNGVVLKCKYFDKNGKLLLTLTFDPSTYKTIPGES